MFDRQITEKQQENIIVIAIFTPYTLISFSFLILYIRCAHRAMTLSAKYLLQNMLEGTTSLESVPFFHVHFSLDSP